MTDKELKNLTRRDLLQILLETERENEALRREVQELRAELNDREIRVQESGTLAEAALQLNGVFEAAQAAADQYLENIRLRNREQASIALRLMKENRAALEQLEKTRQEAQDLEDTIARRKTRYELATDLSERNLRGAKLSTTLDGEQMG